MTASANDDATALPQRVLDQQDEAAALQAELAALTTGASAQWATRLGRLETTGRRVARRVRWHRVPGAPTVPPPPLATPTDEPALEQRLRAAADALTDDRGDTNLGDFGRALATIERPAAAWWSWVVATGSYPTDAELDALILVAERGGPVALTAWVVDEHGRRLRAGATSHVGLRVSPGAVFVDVTHTAAHDVNAGIRRVTRGVAERWHAAHGALLLAWDQAATGPSVLTTDEVAHFLAWRDRIGRTAEPGAPNHHAMGDLVVP